MAQWKARMDAGRQRYATQVTAQADPSLLRGSKAAAAMNNSRTTTTTTNSDSTTHVNGPINIQTAPPTRRHRQGHRLRAAQIPASAGSQLWACVMPLTPVTPPAYPNVPRSSGVPAVFRSAASAIPLGIVTVAADAAQVFRMFQAPQWGIFTKGGQPVAVADSVVGVDFRREARISDYPLEQGAFESYDKVQMPFDIRVRFAVTNSVDLPSLGSLGMSSQRKDFLTAIDRAFKSLDLYMVTTPDATYQSVNITHYDYRRELKGGATLLVVDVWMEEVRVNAQAEYTKSAQPEGEPQQDNGAGQSSEGQPPGRQDAARVNVENAGEHFGPPAPVDTGPTAGDFPRHRRARRTRRASALSRAIRRPPPHKPSAALLRPCRQSIPVSPPT